MAQACQQVDALPEREDLKLVSSAVAMIGASEPATMEVTW